MSHLENQLDNMFNSGESERESLIKELETLRAENAKLIAERDCIEATSRYNYDLAIKATKERDALLEERKEYLANKVLDASDKKLLDRLLAEREAMMKQEPVATVSDWVGARAAKDKISLIVDVPAGFTFLRGQKLYAEPLPAQQIPEGLKGWFVRLTNCLSCYDDGEYFGKGCPQDMLDELEVMLSASQQKGDV